MCPAVNDASPYGQPDAHDAAATSSTELAKVLATSRSPLGSTATAHGEPSGELVPGPAVTAFPKAPLPATV